MHPRGTNESLNGQKSSGCNYASHKNELICLQWQQSAAGISTGDNYGESNRGQSDSL